MCHIWSQICCVDTDVSTGPISWISNKFKVFLRGVPLGWRVHLLVVYCTIILWALSIYYFIKYYTIVIHFLTTQLSHTNRISVTSLINWVQDNSLSESLTTPVSKHITPENHIPQQVCITPGPLTSPEPVTSFIFKDPPLPTYDYLTQEDSSGLNVLNVDSNITDPDLTPGCFEIESV